jgi:hypothetical protein
MPIIDRQPGRCRVGFDELIARKIEAHARSPRTVIDALYLIGLRPLKT